MAHMITDTDSMFSGNRETPWHGLGAVIEGTPTAAEAIKAAGLDWTVDLQPVYAVVGGDVLEVPNQRAAVRSDLAAAQDPRSILGVVGDGYKTVQNIDAFDFADFLAGSGDVRYETAGSLNGGRRVWMLARLDGRMIETVPGDTTIPYLLLSNAHDGSASLRAMLTTVRVVCNNTLSAAHSAGGMHGVDVKIRHSGDVDAKVRAARSVFEQSVRAVDEYADLTKRLANATMTDEAWDALLDIVAPIKDDAVRTKRADDVRDLIRDLADNGAGSNIKGVRGTAWGALNAVTEYVTHKRGTRAVDGRDAADARLESILFGSGAAMSSTALDWLATYADDPRKVLVAA